MNINAKDRLKTGIPGFDEMLKGGIPRNSSLLVSGECGTGKSIFCIQSLYNGATKFNEPGIYLTFEETIESIKKTAELMGWDLDSLEKENKFRVLFKDPYEIKDFYKTFSGEFYYTLTDLKAKRVAIDSLTYLGSTIDSAFETRKVLGNLIKKLRELDCTVFLVSETPFGQKGRGRFGVEEFLVDGVVQLHNLLIKDVRQRALEVIKMRHTEHDTSLRPFEITEQGIQVFHRQQLFRD